MFGPWLTMVLVCTMVAACAGVPVKATDSVPSVCRNIPGFASPTQLCVTINANHEDTWFTRGSDAPNPQQTISGLSFTGIGQASFGDFSISPDGSWLAVSIAEEGHPSLLFRRLPDSLHGVNESGDLPVIAIYPGDLGIEGWEDNDTLIISSDQDLLRPAEHILLDNERRYIVHLPDGVIRAVSAPE